MSGRKQTDTRGAYSAILQITHEKQHSCSLQSGEVPRDYHDLFTMFQPLRTRTTSSRHLIYKIDGSERKGLLITRLERAVKHILKWICKRTAAGKSSEGIVETVSQNLTVTLCTKYVAVLLELFKSVVGHRWVLRPMLHTFCRNTPMYGKEEQRTFVTSGLSVGYWWPAVRHSSAKNTCG